MTAMPAAAADAVVAQALRGAGLVDATKVELAKAYASEHGGTVADALLRLNLVQEADFLRVFAELQSARTVRADTLRGVRPDEALLARFERRVVLELRACPIRWVLDQGELHVVAGVPVASTLESALRAVVGARSLVIHVATPGAAAALILRSYFHLEDAFDAVTANGAGPTIARKGTEEWRAPPRPHALPRDESARQATAVLEVSGRYSPTAMVELPPEGVPEPDGLLEGGTALVNFEALTIDALRRENARYRIAQEFHRRVTLERDVEAMIDRILDVLFELLPADGAALWINAQQSFAKSREGGRRVEVPRVIVEQAMATSAGLLTPNAMTDQRFERSETVRSRRVRSAMAVPLRSRSATLGILYVESVAVSAAFTDDDLPLLDSLAAQAALLLDNAGLVARVQREVELRTGLARFLSKAAVDEVLSGRLTLNLEGQSTELTVLFADIRGFTSLSAQLRPEEVVRFLNVFFAEAVEAVERHGGIVDKFVGDCVMAMWGAVRHSEDDARNAVRAALDMVERAGRIRVADVPLRLGVGLNTGTAVVGAIGGKKRLDYTAIGATVNLAARLCAVAEPQEVLVTAETLRRAGPGLASEACQPVLLKGLDAPVVPHRVRSVLRGSGAVATPPRER